MSNSKRKFVLRGIELNMIKAPYARFSLHQTFCFFLRQLMRVYTRFVIDMLQIILQNLAGHGSYQYCELQELFGCQGKRHTLFN